jgi:PTS system galactitol-specific IIC component
MKLGDCFKSGLHIGIGFVGIGLVIGLMLDSIGPAAKRWRSSSRLTCMWWMSAGQVHPQ